MTRETGILLLLLSLSSGMADAHPHGQIDQQVRLSLGLDSARVNVTIVPSASDGNGIHGHIDLDGDGTISGDEASVLATDVLSETSLAVDGREVRWRNPQSSVPASGPITVSADAQFAPLDDGDHRIAFRIGYGGFSHGWSVSPSFDQALIQAVGNPRVEPAGGGGVTVIVGGN